MISNTILSIHVRIQLNWFWKQSNCIHIQMLQKSIRILRIPNDYMVHFLETGFQHVEYGVCKNQYSPAG